MKALPAVARVKVCIIRINDLYVETHVGYAEQAESLTREFQHHVASSILSAKQLTPFVNPTYHGSISNACIRAGFL